MAASTTNMTMGRFIRISGAAWDGDGAEILTSRPRGSAGGSKPAVPVPDGHQGLVSRALAVPAGSAELRAEALRLEEANHQPQRLSARSPHRSCH
jgi:hypothetical protein